MKKKTIVYAAALLASVMMFGTAAYASDESEPAAVSETETEVETEPETELVLDEPGIMYLLDTVKVHAGADTDSETVGFCDRGSSVSVLGILGEWYHVRLDDPAQKETETEAAGEEQASSDEAGADVQAADAQAADAEGESTEQTEEAAKEGYIFGELLSDDPEAAKAAVEANDAEIARQQAAAAAAAAAAAQGGGGGRSVVSRKKIEDCDGGGGTIITTYSDGSTSTSRY